jgi:glutathione S-transferase
MTITLYGANLSPFVRKVQILLAEKGIDYEQEQISPFNAPDWFADISPMGKIPVLRDSSVGPDATLPDSSVICAYLERKYPEPALYPDDLFLGARARWIEEYSDTALAETIGSPFFYALVVRRLMGQEPDLEAAENATRNLQPPRFAHLDGELAGKEFFVGGALSIADISVASMFVNYNLAGGELDAAAYPNLAGFIERMYARPTVAPLLAGGQKFLAGALK